MLMKLNTNHSQQMCGTDRAHTHTHTPYGQLGRLHPCFYVCLVITPSICSEQNAKTKKKVLPVCKPHLPMKALHIPSAKSSKHTTIHNPHMSYRTSVCTTAHTEVRQLSVGQCSKVNNLNLPQNLWGNHFLPHTKFQIVQISFEIYEN